MRCYSCNRALNDYESTLRSAVSGEFLDMCKKCLSDTDIQFIQSKNNPDEIIVDDEDFDEEDYNEVS